jgi:hypothetical protein
VSPVLSADDLPDCSVSNRKPRRQFGLAYSAFRINLAYFSGFSIGQLRPANFCTPCNFVWALLAPMSVSALLKRSVFCNAIGGIISGGSEKQMIPVYTRWVIARMTNQFIERIRAVLQEIRHAVSPQHMPFRFEHSVAACGIGLPIPAFTRLTDGNVQPEASCIKSVKLGQRFVFSHKADYSTVGTAWATVNAVPTIQA